MRVLVADDDATIRFMLKRMLEKWNYGVEVVDNGEDALRILCGESPPRLVLLDWSMPKMDGIEVCRIIRKRLGDDVGLYVYIIMLTSRSDVADVRAGLDAGADDFIRKPADPGELRSRLASGERTIDYENRLRTKEKEVRLECYRALGALAETRDQETGRHLERIADYSTLLASLLGSPPAFVEDMRTFSPLHDIGKVGIPDSILLAPRRLEPREFEIMKTHSELGYQILHGRPSMEMAAEICRSHHEKWNGTGYPLGLSGDDIPITARIVALVDVYDALRSRRHYKQPWTHEKAMGVVKSDAGVHFDPKLSEIALDMEKEFRKIGLASETEDGDYA
ncbi:MAG: response regulator [Planctomycetota bacterium]|nr:response regulator [Planctomycetota bacterium]